MKKYYKYSRTKFGKNGLISTTHFRRYGKKTYKRSTTCKYLPYHTPYDSNNSTYNKNFLDKMKEWYKNN